MPPNVRKHRSAFILLLFAALTAAGRAQPPLPTDPNAAILKGNVSSVEVTSFTHNGQKPLRAGDTLQAALTGTPGGKASFSVLGVADNLPMTETAPGVYAGRYAVGKNVSARDAAVVGTLLAGGVGSPLTQAPGLVDLDTQPPKLTDFGPASGVATESDRPLIYAALTDGAGTGIDPAASRMRVDGVDVTAQAGAAPALLLYQPPAPLASGPHTVSLFVADKAGNTAALTWSFRVSGTRLVRSLTTNEPPGRPVGAGATVVLTLTAAPGGKASASLGAIARRIPLKETDPGVYAGEYTVGAGVRAARVPVTAKFIARDGASVLKDLPFPLNFAGGPLPVPRIHTPKDSDTVDPNSPLTVKGRGVPGSTVRVSISFLSSAFGGILPVSGQSGVKDVGVSKGGDWEAGDLSLKIPPLLGPGRDTVFTVTATQLDASGTPASDPAAITLRPG